MLAALGAAHQQHLLLLLLLRLPDAARVPWLLLLLLILLAVAKWEPAAAAVVGLAASQVLQLFCQLPVEQGGQQVRAILQAQAQGVGHL